MGAFASHRAALPLAGLLLAVALVLQGRPSAAACRAVPQGDLKLFADFSDADATSVRSQQLPSSGTCNTWAIQLPQNSPCFTQTNGTLMIEMWLTSQGVALDPRTVVQSVYLMAARNQAPSVSEVNGAVSFSPETDFGIQRDPPFTLTFRDTYASNNGLPLHRVFVPVFDAYNANLVDASWFVTLASLNSQLPSSYGYAMRATCMPLEQLPCPRPSPDLWECNAPLPGSPGTSNGQCTVPNPSTPGNKVCSCSSGFGGQDCGITTEVANDVGTIVDVPAKSWRYYTITTLKSSDIRVIAELARQALSAASYQPVLLLSSSDLPGFADIDRSISPFSLKDSCTCTDDCDCHVPYQAQDLIYATGRLQGSTAPTTTWYIGVYNNLQSSQASPTPMTLKVRSNSGSLCPDDCSGRGTCNVGHVRNKLPSYHCSCQLGFGGPYCQGPLQRVALSSDSPGFDSGRAILASGAWQYYTLSNSGSSAIMLSIAFGQTAPLLFVISPVYPLSIGELYFMPATTWVFNSSTTVQIPSQSSPLTWIIGILNVDAETSVSAEYQLQASVPAASTTSDTRFLTTMQMALIGGVSGLIVLLMVFMGVRLVLLRRAMGRLTPEEIAAMSGQGRTHRDHAGSRPARTPGVPPDIVATFPVFTFSAATFEDMKSKRDLLRDEAQLLPPGQQGQEQQQGFKQQQQQQDRQSKEGRLGLSDVDTDAEGDDGSRIRTAVQSASNGDEGDSGSEHGKGDEDEAPTCSVCICDYEEGDVLRRLPCMHIFHQSCIDPWMMQHDTCPNCRLGLCPDRALDARRHRRRHRNQVIPMSPNPNPRAGAGMVEMQQQQQQQQQQAAADEEQQRLRITGAGQTAAARLPAGPPPSSAMVVPLPHQPSASSQLRISDDATAPVPEAGLDGQVMPRSWQASPSAASGRMGAVNSEDGDGGSSSPVRSASPRSRANRTSPMSRVVPMPVSSPASTAVLGPL